MYRKVIVEIICLLFIVLFVYSSTAKLLDNQLFIVQIEQNSILKPFSVFLSFFLPGIELIAAIMLATKRWRMLGLYSFTALMITFTVYIIIILNFSSHIPCSCGGVLQNMGWRSHLIFNIIFVVLGFVAIFISRENRRIIGHQVA